jgi:hypothetical protein
MGCSGSKASQAKAPAAAQAETPSQIPEGDFKINLENVSGSPYSLGAVAQFPESKYILIESVKEKGLIPSWNKGCENTPEMQVKAGDLIVVVNGVFGESDLMLAELKAKAITLTVKRGQPATATQAAEAPASEAAAAATPVAAEAPAVEAPAAEAAVADAAAAPVAEAPSEEAPVAESTAAEAPVVKVLAETPAAAEPAAVATAAAASEEPAVKSPAVVMPQINVQAEDGEISADAREERLCNLCVCSNIYACEERA